MDEFSDALLALAGPRMAEAARRLDRHNAAIAGRSFRRSGGLAWVDGREIPAGILGTLAEDATFEWAWAKNGLDRAGMAHALRLRDLGERHAIPELTEPLVDLGHFADPRVAADRLMLMALGLLGSGGPLKYSHGGRALTYIVTDDPELGTAHESAVPDDPSAWQIIELEVARPLPEPLLTWAVPGIARCWDHEYALSEHLDEEGWDWASTPVWDPHAGTLAFDDILALQAREIARERDGDWEWAAGRPGLDLTRAALREHGAEHLAADRLDIGSHPRPAHLSGFLARVAAFQGEAQGVWTVPGEDGDRHLAISGIPAAGSLKTLCGAVLSAADLLQQLVRSRDRYPVMRSMVVGALEGRGFAPLYVGEPEMLMGHRGVHEIRVLFGHDGTVTAAYEGLIGTLH